MAKKKQQDVQANSVHSVMQSRKRKRQHFLRMRMWIYYLLSAFQKDRGTIPKNIGNRILVTNNLYVTKLYLSSVIRIDTLSNKTPFALCSEIIHELREKKNGAVVDIVFKNQIFDVDLKEPGLQSRIDLWERTATNPYATEKDKETSARCLYTVDQVREGRDLKRTRIFLTIRAKSGTELTKAEKIINQYFYRIKTERTAITSDMISTLKYVSLLCNHSDKPLKGIKAVITSTETLAQMLPNSGSINDTNDEALFLGVDVNNSSEFKMSFEDITMARNIYVLAKSGVGKTVIVLNLISSAVEKGWAACIQDIKGNEFTAFVQGTGGYIVSLRQMSTGFINSFIMHKEEATDRDAEMYFKSRLAFSKMQLRILSGLSSYEHLSDLDNLLEEFLDTLYKAEGVLQTNRSTWKYTEVLSPDYVYERFYNYMTPQVQGKYKDISRRVMSQFKSFMSRNGDRSYVMREEFNYKDILEARTLMFDFGILENERSTVDPVIFRLKSAYMRKLNADYVAYKYSQGIKTIKVLEESQIVADDPDIIGGYVEEFTLRRAQKQTTLLLGNSISALKDSPMTKALIENVTGLLIGELEPEAQDSVIKTFNLEDSRDLILSMGKGDLYKNSFVFINRMQGKALKPVLKVILAKNKKYKLHTPVRVKTGVMM